MIAQHRPGAVRSTERAWLGDVEGLVDAFMELEYGPHPGFVEC
jgi:hypothetical protein